MKRLHEIVNERISLLTELNKLTKEFKEKEKSLNLSIQELVKLENIGQAGINLEYVQLAETVMYIKGDPYGRTDDGSSYLIANAAISDIASGCKHLKKEFFGNKTYGGFYQRCDCKYGYGPSHGGICDTIGLNDAARKRDLTPDEMDACIYYIKNYVAIKKAKSISL